MLDVVRHPSMFRTQHLGPNEGVPTLERWHLDGHGGAVKEERLDDRGQEFPRVDERRVGLPHRYGYAVAVAESDDIVGTESSAAPPRLRAGDEHGPLLRAREPAWARLSSSPAPPTPTSRTAG